MEYLLPAHAGVIRLQTLLKRPIGTSPRARGGDPVFAKLRLLRHFFSPRTRGCPTTYCGCKTYPHFSPHMRGCCHKQLGSLFGSSEEIFCKFLNFPLALSFSIIIFRLGSRAPFQALYSMLFFQVPEKQSFSISANSKTDSRRKAFVVLRGRFPICKRETSPIGHALFGRRLTHFCFDLYCKL